MFPLPFRVLDKKLKNISSRKSFTNFEIKSPYRDAKEEAGQSSDERNSHSLYSRNFIGRASEKKRKKLLV